MALARAAIHGLLDATKPAGSCPVAHCFGLSDAPSLVSRLPRASEMRMTRISCGSEQLGRSPEIPREDSFVIAMYLTPVSRHELWRGGRRVIAQPYAGDSMRIVHLGEGYSAHLYEPHETMCFRLPRAALDAFTEDAVSQRIATLACAPGTIDPVMVHLCAALASGFQHPDSFGPLLVDHIGMAICAHLAHAYGGLPSSRSIPKGGLTPYQERRAKGLLADKSVEGTTVAEIAQDCGLSSGYFTRAFRVTTGQTPHQWLQRQRVDRAKDLLLRSALPIAEVAVALGFSDQSHLTRTFTRMVGESPAAWRRLRAARPTRN
jgi:AraC family transcriptional regulator